MCGKHFTVRLLTKPRCCRHTEGFRGHSGWTDPFSPTHPFKCAKRDDERRETRFFNQHPNSPGTRHRPPSSRGVRPPQPPGPRPAPPQGRSPRRRRPPCALVPSAGPPGAEAALPQRPPRLLHACCGPAAAGAFPPGTPRGSASPPATDTPVEIPLTR